MRDDKRPAWPHKTPESLARWLLGGVKRIEYGWEMTGSDTSRDWLDLTNDKGDTRRVEANLFGSWGEFIFAPSSRGLIAERPSGKVWDTVRALDAWDKRHKAEVAEFKRLRAKFGDSEPPA